MIIATDNTCDQMLQRKCDSHNHDSGNLEGYDCKICKNKGYIMSVKDGLEYASHCKCMEIRNNQKRFEKSGLSDLTKEHTLDSYKANIEWRKEVKNKALSYLKCSDGKWFFIGGQSGAGKTHICTAIASSFLHKGYSVRYMLWKDESIKLKANINTEEKFEKLIEPLKTAIVLYIDDLFKSKSDAEISAADTTLAFEIINFRYNKKNAITLISSEKTIDQIIEIDEATGSRIYQRTNKNEYGINIKADKSKNYRLNGE